MLRAWSVNSSGPAGAINLSSPPLQVRCLVSRLLVSATQWVETSLWALKPLLLPWWAQLFVQTVARLWQGNMISSWKLTSPLGGVLSRDCCSPPSSHQRAGRSQHQTVSQRCCRRLLVPVLEKEQVMSAQASRAPEPPWPLIGTVAVRLTGEAPVYLPLEASQLWPEAHSIQWSIRPQSKCVAYCFNICIPSTLPFLRALV